MWFFSLDSVKKTFFKKSNITEDEESPRIAHALFSLDELDQT